MEYNRIVFGQIVPRSCHKNCLNENWIINLRFNNVLEVAWGKSDDIIRMIATAESTTHSIISVKTSSE